MPKSSYQSKINPSGRHKITTRTDNQSKFVTDIRTSQIALGLGAAGTGKTFLSVACALEMLHNQEAKYNRIILTRPAVEAGEKIGFLPGDASDKIGMYLLPLYDCLDRFLTKPVREKYIEEGKLEISPLGFMRGRDFQDAIIIVDEAQNATKTQIKMVLTRLGSRSIAILSGDPTQTDLPYRTESGLADAASRLEGKAGVSVTRFSNKDIVRSRIVETVVEAYDD